jgi:hypothetical protein
LINPDIRSEILLQRFQIVACGLELDSSSFSDISISCQNPIELKRWKVWKAHQNLKADKDSPELRLQYVCSTIAAILLVTDVPRGWTLRVKIA